MRQLSKDLSMQVSLYVALAHMFLKPNCLRPPALAHTVLQ